MVQNYSETNKMDCQWDENEQAELFITCVRGGPGGGGGGGWGCGVEWWSSQFDFFHSNIDFEVKNHSLNMHVVKN